MRILVTGPVSTLDLLSEPTRVDLPAPLPTGLGGSPVNNLVNTLRRSDHQITVVSLDRSVPAGGEVTLDEPGLRVRYGPYRRGGRARDMFRTERSYLEQAIREESPDVIHAHWQYEFALGALASGLPTVVTCHDWAPAVLRRMPSPYRAVRLMMQMMTLRRAQWLTAVSPFIRDRVSRWTDGKITLVPNSVPEGFFPDAPERTFHGNHELIAINSGFPGVKNVKTLLKAFHIWHHERGGGRLTLVGDGYDPRGPAWAWAERHDLTDGVRFLGPVANADIPQVLSGADLFVHPSVLEACPMVLIEAMAQGLPVVGGLNSGGVPWMLDEGRAGLLTDVSSPIQLANAIERLISDPTEWRHYSIAARRRAQQAFHPDVVASQYLSTYVEAVHGN